MSPVNRESDRDQFWRTTVAGKVLSGQSVRAYCASRQISQASYYYWKRTLAARPVRSSSPAFAAVRVVADPLFEIVLPTGLVVRVPVGTDPVAVARLVTALGGPPC
jgi:hypothetical protein